MCELNNDEKIEYLLTYSDKIPKENRQLLLQILYDDNSDTNNTFKVTGTGTLIDLNKVSDNIIDKAYVYVQHNYEKLKEKFNKLP